MHIRAEKRQNASCSKSAVSSLANVSGKIKSTYTPRKETISDAKAQKIGLNKASNRTATKIKLNNCLL